MLQAPTFGSPLHLLADFVELACLAESSGRYPLRRLKAHLSDSYEGPSEPTRSRPKSRGVASHRNRAAIEEQDDDLELSLDDDPAIAQDDEIEQRYVEIIEELDRRSVAAGEGYPYSFEENSRYLISKARTPARTAYLFCLLVSSYRKGDLLPSSVFAANAAEVEELFQICGTIAGAGFVDGEAVSFNFPRTELPSSFLQALSVVYPRLFPEGRPKTSFMPADNRKVKDASVDVIAWRTFPDRRPGNLYMLGQCASGNDYLDKSIRSAIVPFHEDWFIVSPRSSCIPTLLIPFVAERDISVYKNENAREVTDEYLLRITRDYGAVLDRCRIAYCISRIEARTSPDGVDRYDDLSSVEAWVGQISNTIAAAAA